MANIILYSMLLQVTYFLVPRVYDTSHIPSQAFQTIGMQGDCGICAIFASTHAYAMRLYLQFGVDYIPSSQEFQTCYNVSCVGGIRYTFFVDHVKNMHFESRQCQTNETKNVVYVFVGMRFLLYPEIYFRGPVAASVFIDDSWMNNEYAKTNILSCVKENQDTGHLIVLTGWGKDYWIIKNSWGAGWGRGGYAYIETSCVTHGLVVQPYRDEWTSYAYEMVSQQQHFLVELLEKVADLITT